ncbi:MAG: GDSL-type esterase/lipase family protein [Gemmataceae bacterium]
MRLVYLCLLSASLLCVAAARSNAADDTLLHDMDAATRFRTGEKDKIDIVDGNKGKALRFTYPEKCQNVFIMTPIRGKPAWDQTDGFSFWVKGDGSDHFGGLQFIYDEDYAVRYDYMFPIKGTDWQKVTVAWSDLIPVLPGAKSVPLSKDGPNKPSKLSALWFGKWWYWRDYAAHSFAVDELRLEAKIERPTENLAPKGPPLARTLDKLKAGQPVTIVTMGDSLTDTRHWANREVDWANLLKKQLESKYKSKVTIINPAIGGTQLRQNLVLIPRWLAQAPEPDLVAVCFGGNDWDSGMRGPQFEQTTRDAIERIRRATAGKADVLILTTLPTVKEWTTRNELGEACRQAARQGNAGLADTELAFHEEGKNAREKLFARDQVHLGPFGHEVMARTVLEVIEKAGAGK